MLPLFDFIKKDDDANKIFCVDKEDLKDVIDEFENVKLASESPTNNADDPQKLCSIVELVTITIIKITIALNAI